MLTLNRNPHGHRSKLQVPPPISSDSNEYITTIALAWSGSVHLIIHSITTRLSQKTICESALPYMIHGSQTQLKQPYHGYGRLMPVEKQIILIGWRNVSKNSNILHRFSKPHVISFMFNLNHTSNHTYPMPSYYRAVPLWMPSRYDAVPLSTPCRY